MLHRPVESTGSFFVIPSIFVLWLLSYLAAAHSDIPAISGLLYGVQPVVIAIVVEAVLRIGKRTLNHSLLVVFAVLAFVALYVLSIPFPLVVVAAGVGGLLLAARCQRHSGVAGTAVQRRRKARPWSTRPPRMAARLCFVT